MKSSLSEAERERERKKELTMAMAGIATVTLSLTNGARLFSVPRTLAKTNSYSFLSTQCSSALGFYSVQQRCTVPSRKLVIRAARTESKGVSLGFRAPQFEVSFLYYLFIHILTKGINWEISELLNEKIEGNFIWGDFKCHRNCIYLQNVSSKRFNDISNIAIGNML